MPQMVGAYPFERPEDKNDTQKLQKMIQVNLCSLALAAILHQASRLACLPSSH